MRLSRAGSLALIALLVAACSTPVATPTVTVIPTVPPTPRLTPASTAETHVLTGTFTLNSRSERVDLSGDSCTGTGGYNDIGEGLGVVVSNETGVTIGTGSLVFDSFEGEQVQNVAIGSCIFEFRVPNVPRASFYSVEVGSRGELTYSYAEMVGMSWRVELTLGS